MATPWASEHETLLGQLSYAKESLTDIALEADLDEIKVAMEALQSAIDESNEKKMEEDFEDEDEEDREEEEEEEDEEQD